MRTLPLAQIGPAKINVALRQVAEAPGIVAAKTLSAVYRNVSGLALTHEALTQNPANAATMPSKASVGAQERPERDTKRAFTQAEEEALVAWVAANPEANEAQLVTLVDVLAGRACGSPKPSTPTGGMWGSRRASWRCMARRPSRAMPDWLVSRLRDRKKSIPVGATG